MKLPVGEALEVLGNLAGLDLEMGAGENIPEFIAQLKTNPFTKDTFEKTKGMLADEETFWRFYASIYFTGFHAGITLEHAAHTKLESNQILDINPEQTGHA